MSHVAHVTIPIEHAPEYVAAPIIARKLSVTSRYVLQLAEQGKIPCVRLGRKCVRFNLAEVSQALGANLTGGAEL
jgi:excisionase family DNA binding protein